MILSSTSTSTLLMMLSSSLLLLQESVVNPFTVTPQQNHYRASTRSSKRNVVAAAAAAAAATPTEEDLVLAVESDESSSSLIIKSPLKYLGPYVALGLKFPNAATSSQRTQNKTGISLDFVLDTAANVNTINSQVAHELEWDQNIVGTTLPGYSASGSLASGQTYQLGDAQLEAYSLLVSDDDSDLGDETDGEQFLFMQNLTASALPVASPASAGLLSLAFMYCFEGGIEFDWNIEQPSITFFGSKLDRLATKSIEGLTKIPINPIEETNLPSITLEINGKRVPALLDTGSPITVLNSKAANLIGVNTVELPTIEESKNPFANVASKFKQAQAMAELASRGDVLTIGGQNGPVNLLKSLKKIPISAVGDGDENSKVTFGGKDNKEGSYVYVGDIPGLAALNGLGKGGSDNDVSPAMILGLDVIRQNPTMVLRAQDNEVYF